MERWIYLKKYGFSGQYHLHNPELNTNIDLSSFTLMLGPVLVLLLSQKDISENLL